jgi:hypothetical protein
MNKADEFIKKAIKKFGDRYDYLEMQYISSIEKINIRCNKHNIIFNQLPSAHLRGQVGCPVCKNRITTTEELISKAK